MSEIAPALASAAAVAPARAAPMPARWRDYVTLTKPRIMSLLVLTSVCAMIAAAHGDPAPIRLLALVLGGALACGGASALNHVLDRDIDRLMGPRTATRPVAAGRIAPAHAVAFGIGLLALAVIVLTAFDNLLAATLSLAGAALYVLVYTVWLKRRTAQNIVIGGAAGAIPPLAGWAAANGQRRRVARSGCLRSSCCGPRRTSGRSPAAGAALRRRGRPDAAGRARRRRHGAADPRLLGRAHAADARPRRSSARSAASIS